MSSACDRVTLELMFSFFPSLSYSSSFHPYSTGWLTNRCKFSGVGRTRATAARSLPSLLKSDTLTSMPCPVTDRDLCAIQLLGQVKLVMERWPQTPITSPEDAGCAHEQEAVLVVSLHSSVFFSVILHDVFRLYFQVQS